jgi:hypothetical protein
MKHSLRLKSGLLALVIFLPALTLLLGPTESGHAQANTPGSWITPRGGQPFFVIGANYEGPTAQAWMMWQPDKFDPNLIEEDFARAQSIGINTLRIFVQTPLRDDVNRNDFSKLDAVTALARSNHLWLIVTFTDWAEPDLAKAADLNKRIAAHLAAEPSILAYDVKNEPQLTDIAGAIYPSGTMTVPLQLPDLIATYGEKVARADIGNYRTHQGSFIPSRMTDDQAYLLANYYELYKAVLSDGATWVGSHPNSTTLDYMDSPDSAKWQPFLAGVDATLAAWTKAQIDPVRSVDPGRPITAGYSNIVFAKLPSNRALTFQSLHRFTSHGYAGVNTTFLVLNNIRTTFAGQPVLLEEFGYAGQTRGSGGSLVGFDPRTTANLESAIWSFLYANGFAGGAKWMLNNFPGGDNPEENTYGLFDNSGEPKVTARVLGQLSTLFDSSPPGTLSQVSSADKSAVTYAYTSPGTLVAGGQGYADATINYTSTFPSNLVMNAGHGGITLFATDNATVTLKLTTLFGVSITDVGRIVLTAADAQGKGYTPDVPSLEGEYLVVALKALSTYHLTAVPKAVDRADAVPSANSVYFPQTGHNLSADFLTYWQHHGGVSIFGYPVSEPFVENGLLVQYFERNRFELHSENQPPYNVLLGRLGADSMGGRVFAPIAPFQSEANHRFFPETGHSVNFAFLGYWNRNGGLAQFGYPISEELTETSPTDGKQYTVQYFERARFEYHPEYKGTNAEVLLSLLGVTTLQDKGWIQ